MPINTDLNVSPYFDDYDEKKDYHRVLFRPSVPVQARELTQLQTILQTQIERFGNWAFSSGDTVEGCVPIETILPFVRIRDFASNSSSNSVSFIPTDHIGKTVVGQTTGLEAIIMTANSGYLTNYPATNILYLYYKNTGTNGETAFGNNELLRIKTVAAAGNTWIANIYSYANSATNHVTTGNAVGIAVTEGVVYLNGNFVRVSNSTVGLVNAYGTIVTNNVIGFILEEKIITENDDETLVDNSLGYPNENAPGAHRLQLIPRVISMSEQEAACTDFVSIGRYNYGSLVTKSGPQSSNLYSIVGDVVAKRTYEESGNYVVNPFTVDSVTTTPDPNVVPENSDCVLGRVNPGTGYSQGYRVTLDKTAYANMRRGVDTKVYNDQNITFNYGNYFVLNEVAGTFDFDQAQTVKLYNRTQSAVTNRTFAALTPSGTQIGTAKIRCFSYNSGSPGTKNALYLLHVFDISLVAGYNSTQIKSVFYDGTNKGVGDVFSAGLVESGNKVQLYSFGFNGIKNLRDDDGDLNTLYDYRTKQSGTIATTGLSTITITGGNRQLPYGLGKLVDSEATNFTVVVTANTDSDTIDGATLTVSTSTVDVTASGVSLITNFMVGDQIKVTNGVTTTVKTITSIANSSFMTVDSAFSFSTSSATFKKSLIKGKILALSEFSGGVSSFITINSTTQFTINTGLSDNDVNFSSSIPIDVFFNVRKIKAVPSKKEIKKNRFVIINTSTNPTGPWCLGFSDVHKVNAIYANTGAVTTASSDVTDQFVYDTGQLDTHYGLAFLYPKPGTVASANILVNLDYFSANLSTGVGFFTVESYPIDDINTSNSIAIQTKDIPLYVSENGFKIPLKDVIDFRIPCNPTASDATTVGSATTNPSNTVTFKIDASKGLETPAYGQNFQSDYTRYLPRKDLIMMTPDNILKIKEGTSSDSPQTPLNPDNAMPLAIINIPPYPSLSSDQVDELSAINKRCKSLVRDTTSSISSNIVTNRRYTMKDIGTLDQRITNLEYYTQLSLLEKAAKDMTVTDGNGLDRFKNGIFVDPFSDFSLGEVSNPEYSIAIDTRKGVARPKIIREVFKIDISNAFTTVNDPLFTSGRNFFIDGTNFIQKTGRLVTLPYDETFYIAQPYATKFRSSALVAYAWNGKLTLIPCYDNNQEQNITGSLNIVIDNASAWEDFAQSPMGLQFGDWQYTTTSTSNTVVTGDVKNINFTATGMNVSTAEWQGIQAGNRASGARVLAAVQRQAAAAGIDPNLVQGNLTVTYGGRVLGNL